MTAIVISKWSGKNIAYAVPVTGDMTSRWVGGDLTVILEYVFRQTNRVDGNEFISTAGIEAPSTSVGDLVIIEDRYFLCEGVGWREISAKDAIVIQKVEVRA